MLDAMTRGRNRSYTQAELGEVADGLERLLNTIEQGELTAGPGTVSRLEGAMIALRSLAVGKMISPDEILQGSQQSDSLGSVAGIDGCRGGWVVVTVAADSKDGSFIEQVPDLTDIVARVDSGQLRAMAIDIPIGLPEIGPRRCDLEARKMIGSRRSSVFPTPVRAVLGATSYEEALARSRSAGGKGLSRQAFAILPKIAEVDRLITPKRQRQVVEVHPEVCFTVLAGTAMSHHKATPEGRAERLSALRGVFSDVDAHAARRLPGTQPDDILDAYVAAWTASRWLTRTHLQLGGDLDAHGLRMEMVV